MSKNEAVTRPEILDSTTYVHPPHEEIAARAYGIFLERGATPGRDLDDWLQAEEELVKKRVRVLSPPTSAAR